MYSYPKDKPSYWAIVDQYWPDLLNIIRQFAPDMVDEAQTAKQNQDAWVITDAFNMAWINAPDSPSIHRIPSWHVLCDLCSESYVLFDEEGKPL
jgi:hypothetical protein